MTSGSIPLPADGYFCAYAIDISYYHDTLMIMKSTTCVVPSRSALPIALLERMAITRRVLAHPHRLKIVELLERESEAPVAVIQNAIGLHQAATSQHLNHMKRVGLLASERRGKEVWYTIADRRALTILGCIRKKHGDKS